MVLEDEIMSRSGRRVALGVRRKHDWRPGSTDTYTVAAESSEFVGAER